MSIELSVAKAKSIIKNAQKQYEDEDGEEIVIYEGDIPDSEEKVIEDATLLVEQALDARENGWENPAVDAVLFAYESDADGDSGSGGGDSEYTWNYIFELHRDDLEELIDEEELDDVTYNRRTSDDDLSRMVCEALGIEEPDEEDEEDEEPEKDADGDPVLSYDSIWESDREQLKEIIEEQELDVGYNRRTSDDKIRERICEVLGLEPSQDDPDDEEEEQEEPEAELSPPWRGYDARKQEQILRKLPKLDDEALAEVYDYEKANKNRKGIMNALAKLAEERAEDEEEQETEDNESAEEGEESGSGGEGAEREDADEDSGGEADGESVEGGDPSPEEDEEAGYDPQHHKLVRKITQRVEDEHFAVPKKLPREITEMPFDLTKVSDEEIRRLHSAFTAYFARAAYVAKLEGQLADACKHVADKKFNEVLNSIDRIDPNTKKEKNVTLLKAEAEGDETVQLWRDRERTHTALSKNSSKDCDIYDRNLISLSREWTMRHEEIEHSGGLSKKRKGR